MSLEFIDYLKSSVPEYYEYIIKYGELSIKKINKLIEGVRASVPSTIERGTIPKYNSAQNYSHDKFYTDMTDLVHNLCNQFVIMHDNIKKVKDFHSINGFNVSGSLIHIQYTVYESMEDFNERKNEVERLTAMNNLIPLIQKASADFNNNKKSEIKVQRIRALKKKIELLEKELLDMENEDEEII